MRKVKKAKKLTKKRLQKGSIGGIFIYVVLGLLIVSSLAFVGGIPSSLSPSGKNYVNIVTPAVQNSKSSLQLETFGFVTPTPTPPVTTTVAPAGPKTSCGPEDDNGKEVSADCKCLDASVTCKSGQPYDDNGNPLTGEIGYPPVAVNKLCGSYLAPGDGRYCVAKPVIYLYPQFPTLVNVSVSSTGKITVSDPLYPEGGWKNVLAKPDGTLFYEGKKYSELFYESDVTSFKKPENGIVIPTNKLKETLSSILDQLGLNGSEKEEFLSFWLPRLTQLHSPYIFFSLIDKSTKDKIDNVSISPKPDTMIDFIAYFKPVNNTELTTLQLPPPPIRKGYVAVEWGGVLDLNSKINLK